VRRGHSDQAGEQTRAGRHRALLWWPKCRVI
jgi:hypothetical protein